ncbi:hypothetical protein [Microbacterium algeriense]|uniref:hypothetical protein n=1 Tax=Microbacterium algeriense TaxID=2615184 RepID=UPI0002FA7DE3|nr:hypothetical protein [Microbacterium barkeri]
MNEMNRRPAQPGTAQQSLPGRASQALLVASLGVAVAFGGVALAAQAASADEVPASTPPSSASTSAAPTVEATHDAWTIAVSKSADGVEITQTVDGAVAVSGHADLVDVAPGDVTSLGPWVAGSDFDFVGVGRLNAVGQAGDDVTAVTITTSTGRVVETQLKDGIWLAAWNGDLDTEAGGGGVPDSGVFTITSVTADGAEHTVTSVDVATTD